MTPEEQVAIANIARYHRGPRPKKKHGNFGGLDRALRDRIERLAAILRVADGFDRGHVGTIEKIKVRWLDRALRLTPVPTARTHSLRLELWGASRKSDLLARVAGVPVEIVNPDGSVVPIDAEITESD
jgi:exopolyphosphatase / guanosine-5'-triphosphate,3'-diphosphate pyrophosphatase